MSDLSTQQALLRSRTQLPVTSYFDPALYEQEMKLIFDAGPRYVGHELMVPARGDFHALAQEREGRALIRTDKGVELVSNVCRHRQAVMLKGRGNTGGNVVCPLHRYKFSLSTGRNTSGEGYFLRTYPVKETDDGLFVADGKIAPRQDDKQLTISPNIAPVVLIGEAGGNDQSFVSGRFSVHVRAFRKSADACLRQQMAGSWAVNAHS